MRTINILLAAAPLLLHAAPPAPIEWEMTPAAFGGRKAIVTLDNGARIEGNWLSVTPATFTIDVERARGKNPPPRGVHTLDRSAIVELRLQERRIRGRVWGTVFGFVAGSSALATVYRRSWERGGPTERAGPAAGVFYGVLAASYLAGRVFDKATREVRIKPASPKVLTNPADPAPPQENEGEHGS
jgi:hypothetical protein